MSSKRQKRIKETVATYEAAIITTNQEELLQSRADQDLFTIDTTGSKTKKRKIQSEQQQLAKGTTLVTVSQTEKKLVQKLLNDRQLLDEKLQASQKKGQGLKKPDVNLHDLWGNDVTVAAAAPIVPPQNTTHKKTKKISLPGQSYNPSTTDHQDIIANALALEIKRSEEEMKKKLPFFTPNTDEIILTENLLEDDEDDDGDDEGEEVDVTLPDGTVIRKRIKERLTTAQKNKRKARTAVEVEKSKQDAEAQLLKTIDKIPTIVKEIELQEKVLENKLKLKKLTKQRKAEMEPGMTKEEVSLVPLSDELNGSLRQLKPKGNTLKIRTKEMTQDGLLMSRERRKRTKKDKPHKAKKEVWIPKYKYKGDR